MKTSLRSTRRSSASFPSGALTSSASERLDAFAAKNITLPPSKNGGPHARASSTGRGARSSPRHPRAPRGFGAGRPRERRRQIDNPDAVERQKPHGATVDHARARPTTIERWHAAWSVNCAGSPGGPMTRRATSPGSSYTSTWVGPPPADSPTATWRRPRAAGKAADEARNEHAALVDRRDRERSRPDVR